MCSNIVIYTYSGRDGEVSCVLQVLGKVHLEQKYRDASAARRLAMNALMWHESSACWKDLILQRSPAAGKCTAT